MRDKIEILDELAQAVIDMEEDLAADVAKEAIDSGILASEAINKGLIKGMEVVGDLYEKEEYFIPEVLLCSDAMNAGIEVLQPHLLKDDKSDEKRGEKVVIGVVEGDTHDIGKNLVKIMLEASGFEVYDLGRNVPLEEFVKKAVEVDAKIIAMSTLMTTTMDGMGKVIEMLKEQGIRDDHLVLVGGGPISLAFAQEIGADLYAADANSAIRKLKELLEVRSCA